MVATRRSQRGAPVEEEDHNSDELINKAAAVNHYEDPASDSDDEAPEEVTLATGKETAAKQRKKEHDARKHVATEAKDRRKRRQDASQSAAKPATAAADTLPSAEELNEEDEEEAFQNAEDLDLLPDDIIEAIAQGTDRRPLERRIISDQLRTSLQRKPKKIKKDPNLERRVGPVTVKVLKGTEDRKPSEAAKAFLQQRLYGGVKRTNEMLRPTQIGGMFVYGPKRS